MIRRRFLLLWAAPALAQPTFTSQLWQSIEPVYRKTLGHPFLKGLTDGSLPQDRFRFYIIQDSLYLKFFSQALNLLASKALTEDWAMTLSRHAIESIQAERELHDKILLSYGVSPAEAARVAPAPTNRAYANHLLNSVSRLSFAEGLAAMLPCYWVYWEVGKELKKKGSPEAAYQRWIDQYAGESYGKTVQVVLDMMNRSITAASSGERASARELFVLSSRYEYMFWDMAWRTEQWPP
jgi:thiaminase (transcriptional activator TenA)